jgi:hypothetical protein
VLQPVLLAIGLFLGLALTAVLGGEATPALPKRAESQGERARVARTAVHVSRPAKQKPLWR